ncbi:MAG: Gfo/Idh/MocA family protein [Planctomycetia bacterium]
MAKQGRLGVAVLGAGGIAAKLHLPELAAIDAFEVRVLAGRKRSRLDRLVALYGGRAETDYRAALTAPDVDAVVVATPHPLHVDLAIDCIKAGKHLLLQKPLCGDLDEARRFAAAAAGATASVFCLPHFAPEVVKTRELVDAGAVGVVSGAYCRTSHGGPEVYYAQIRRMFDETGDDLWFFDKNQAAVGALFDMGVYAVAYLTAVLGSVTQVYGRLTTVAKPTALEDGASLLLDFARGIVGSAETSWCDPSYSWALNIHGTTGKLSLGHPRDRRLSLTKAASKVDEDLPPTTEAVDLSIAPAPTMHQAWLETIETGRPHPLSNWRAAVHVTEVLLAGRRSSDERRPIDVVSRLDD